jgi:hypothetical protein
VAVDLDMELLLDIMVDQAVAAFKVVLEVLEFLVKDLLEVAVTLLRLTMVAVAAVELVA